MTMFHPAPFVRCYSRSADMSSTSQLQLQRRRRVDGAAAPADARASMRPTDEPADAGAERPSGVRDDLPIDRLRAFIFDMDGVITDTAAVHRAAWKELFDGFLANRADPARPFRPFDEDDYRRFVDGKPREAGVRDFLASRGIRLPEGDRADPPDRDTVVGLGLRKNALFLERVAEGGVVAFPGTLDFIDRLTAAGRRVAVISASENATQVLSAAGVLDRFDVKVDGLDSRRLHLAGKPDPAIFLEAARRLGHPPGACAIVEDALAGVEAGVRGGFAFVLAVDRAGFRAELVAAGASLVVEDLGELLLPT
jgi:alpha,alpha-trehalase